MAAPRRIEAELPQNRRQRRNIHYFNVFCCAFAVAGR
jgi:hypothetical protein